MSLRPKLSLINGDMETPSQGLMEGREEIRSYMQDYREKNRDKYNAYQREWRRKNKAVLSARNVNRRKLGIAAMSGQELKEFRLAECAKTKRLNERVKNEVFMAYGGWKCNCCGETEHNFLSVDHVQNDGYKMRKEHGHSSRFYRWLRRNKYPSGYQVLCMNCNFGKRMNNGICPHQQGVTTMAQASRGKCPEAQSTLMRVMR